MAAGLHQPSSLTSPFAAAQGTWRFYSYSRLELPSLAGPLIECAPADILQACVDRLLVAVDWSPLHFGGHCSKADRVELAHSRDLGYDLLTALAIGDRDGSPIAPLCLELRAADGTYSTRAHRPLKSTSHLDGLGAVMAHVEGCSLGRKPVFIIDREADSVGHYRAWDAAGHRFVVRADNNRVVRHEGRQRCLDQVGNLLKARGALIPVRTVLFRGRPTQQFIAETTVVLHRAARTHRVDPRTGQAKHRNIAGAPLELRLVVS